MNRQAGTSIIEIVVYVGLLTLIMGSSVLILFQIVHGDERREQAALVQEEAHYMMEKIGAFFSYGTRVSKPMPGSHGDMLIVTMPQTPREPITLYRDGNYLMIQRGTNTPEILNASSAPITNLDFDYSAATHTMPATLRVVFSVGDEEFTQTHVFLP